MIAKSGTTTFGLVVWTLGVVVMAWLVSRVFIWFRLRKETPSSWSAVKGSFEGSIHDIAVQVSALVALGIVVWIGFIPVTIYQDHAAQTSQLATLICERNKLARDLDAHKNTIFVVDPAFWNITKLLQTFQVYRVSRKSKPCVIYITAPPDSMALASTVAQLSNSVSGCSTFGPSGEGNPDLDEMTKDGMFPNVIVVHTQRDNRVGMTLQENLASQIQTRISYVAPKVAKNHLYGQSCCGYTEDFVWLQFGTGVKWNSEKYQTPK